jgi:tripartite-type tricarboxylate transporter receptor subunit TctC
VTSAESKFKSFTDLLDAARNSPSGLTYGSAGIGSTHHLAGELLGKMGHMNLVHIPYRGDAASITALLANDVNFIIAPPTAVISNIKSGKLRALATTGPQRWSGLPDLSTVAEQGVSSYDVRSWAGLMAPAGTPKTVVDKLNVETNKALQLSSIKSRLEDMGGEARGSTPEEMRQMLSSELQRWTQVINDAKIPKQ